MVPTIETPRLVLRETRLSDFPDYSAMWLEPEVLAHTLRTAPDPELMWTRFLRGAGFWHYHGFGMFTVEEKESGRFVGQVGFFDSRRAIEPSMAGTVEAGWTLRRAHHGRGYGTEAVGALMRWGEATLGGRRAVAIIDAANTGSRAIAERHGFAFWTEAVYRGEPTLLFDRTL